MWGRSRSSPVARLLEQLALPSIVPRSRLDPDAPGETGPDTVLDTSLHPPAVHASSLVLVPGSSADDLAMTWPCFVVTERLAGAVDTSELVGARRGDVDVRLDEQLTSCLPPQAGPT